MSPPYLGRPEIYCSPSVQAFKAAMSVLVDKVGNIKDLGYESMVIGCYYSVATWHLDFKSLCGVKTIAYPLNPRHHDAE